MKIAVFGETLRSEVIASLTSDKRISIVDNVDYADVLLSLGGDGTLLNTLSVIGSREIPVLGVNLGRLGFLTGATRDDIPSLAAMLLNREFSTVKRSVLEVLLDNSSNCGLDSAIIAGDCVRHCEGEARSNPVRNVLHRAPDPAVIADNCVRHCEGEARSNPVRNGLYALNEAAILRDENSSTISVAVFVDNLLLNNYHGDGVIFATPTGSTAYSLSCGGPVLPPEADNIVVTPIASHTLTVRPLVLTGNAVLRAECSVPCKLTLDARKYSLPAGTSITIKRAPFPFITMKPKGKEFFETLREKLFWGL
ncbi:MAG: NAD(+)/NADH kinase [Bacteroidales bacterium]|jgi:NAD+ kinase|nr:NAD(+)/NADH kinase [Bacteroidales bacterium]